MCYNYIVELMVHTYMMEVASVGMTPLFDVLLSVEVCLTKVLPPPGRSMENRPTLCPLEKCSLGQIAEASLEQIPFSSV